MTDLQIRVFAFQHARDIAGPAAPVEDVLAAAEAIFRFLTEDRGPTPVRN